MREAGLDREAWIEICLRLGLTILVGSTGIYGGTCPFCEAKKSFFIFLDGRKDKKRIACDNCLLKGEVLFRPKKNDPNLRSI